MDELWSSRYHPYGGGHLVMGRQKPQQKWFGGSSLPNLDNGPRLKPAHLAIFALTALAWITRSEPFGGWKTWLDYHRPMMQVWLLSPSYFVLSAQWRK